MKLIIFDIDGTLSNTSAIDDITFLACFDSLYNIQIEQSKLSIYKHISDNTDLGLFRYIHKELFNRAPELIEIQRFKEYFFQSLQLSYNSFPKLFSEIPGAKLFIEYLYNSSEWKIAIATGCWSESAAIKLQAIGLSNLNIPISSSDAIANRTHILSNAAILAEEHYQVTGFDKIYYFGDGIWDLQAAEALNFNFIGIDYFNKNTFFDSNPHFVLSNFLEFKDFLQLL